MLFLCFRHCSWDCVSGRADITPFKSDLFFPKVQITQRFWASCPDFLMGCLLLGQFLSKDYTIFEKQELRSLLVFNDTTLNSVSPVLDVTSSHSPPHSSSSSSFSYSSSSPYLTEFLQWSMEQPLHFRSTSTGRPSKASTPVLRTTPSSLTAHPWATTFLSRHLFYISALDLLLEGIPTEN